MNWQIAVDIVGILLGAAGLIASIASYRQSQRAAAEAREAKERSEEAAAKSSEAIILLRRDLEQGTVLDLLLKIEALSAEMEMLFTGGSYPSVLLRARDISKELVYLIGRWNDVIPSGSLATIVDSNAKIEQLRDRLQQSTNISTKEHARLFGIVKPVIKSLATERARAQKRKEENARY